MDRAFEWIIIENILEQMRMEGTDAKNIKKKKKIVE